MADYKAILDQQLDTLDDTIKRQNKENKQKEGSSLTGKLMHTVYTNPRITKTIGKYTAITGVGYVAGGMLPIVSGPAIAALCLLGYVGKRCIYDPHVKKKQENRE